MTTKMYKCGGCDTIIAEYDIETAGDPFGDGTVEVCPECNTAEMLKFAFEVDEELERREEARLDAMYESRYAEED